MSGSRRPAAADWSERITAQINRYDGSVTLPQRAAQWLHARAAVPYEQRERLRDRDPKLYAAIAALRLSALSDPESWPATSDLGKELANEDAQQQESEWLTSKRAAEIAGVTDRCIRGWIRNERLPARRHGHTWRISRTDLLAAIHTA
ncbi:helix-turn-helix domain-containing protein [Mycobacterium sp. E2479]|uniref:helix-turn-helix domain-containing protein n=1 Tax=Mycobacterium sp. E2479 TaxID=1834134 RepID=UPI00080184A0|nr:helix-turn-helix domain-containing protein [Mycobacterium sp. E2479]OBH55471.1 hypothetical protein A5686_06420 [Mycobacterium sp. E2479]